MMRAIRAHQARKGFPISIRELCDELGIRSTNGVSDHLAALVKKGFVTRERQRSRTLQLTTAGQREIHHG